MRDNLFHEVMGEFVIIRNKRGVFRQEKVFVKNAEVFCRLGSGFIRLMGNGGTSNPETTWEKGTEFLGIGTGRFNAPCYYYMKGHLDVQIRQTEASNNQ